MPQSVSSQSVGGAIIQKWNSFLASKQDFSVDRLRSLYADLLRSIDVTNDDVGRRNFAENEKSFANDGGMGLRKFFRGISFLDRGSNHSNSDRKPELVTPRRDLSAAFEILSATPSAQKEGDNGGAIAVRYNLAVTSLQLARAREAHVAQLIRSIGEIVVHGEQTSGSRVGVQLRSDGVFEYFCEKSIISLFVDIAAAKPPNAKENVPSPCFHAVTWTAVVKAQVLKTVSMLISNSQESTLYYLLSNNHVNDLIACMLPMRQWSDPALEQMMPVYVRFLETLASKLSNNPNLFPFLKKEVGDSSIASFPLFTAAQEVSMSSFAQSNSSIYFTCTNLVVNILQILNPQVRFWMGSAETEQQLLVSHLCQRILDRYERLARLVTGPVIDPVRSSAIIGQLKNLQDQYEYLNEVLWCGIRTLNVRVCEFLLQRVVLTLLRNLVGGNKEKRLCVGVTDGDTIPKSEALAHVSAMLLAQLFLSVEYAPFLRMLAVAILHPQSPEPSTAAIPNSESQEYVLTPALNFIVQEKSENEESSNGSSIKLVSNPFREELMAVLRGDEGDWRFIPVAMLLESILVSDALDLDTLQCLKVVPSFKEADEGYPESPWESAIKVFLCRKRNKASSVSTLALECAGSLSLATLSHVVNAMRKGGEFVISPENLCYSPIVHGLLETRSMFYSLAREMHHATGVSEHFVDLLELAINSRYALKEGDVNERYFCPLSKYACTAYSHNPEILVRRYRDVSSNDIEDTRFVLNMALHFRGICNAIEKLLEEVGRGLDKSESTPRRAGGSVYLDMDDVADSLIQTIGGLKAKPALGTDLDVRGRTTFHFSTSAGRGEFSTPSRHSPDYNSSDTARKRKLSEELRRSPSSGLLLVMDPTDIFVLNPSVSGDENRGRILCSTPLTSVIAFAPDGAWLHLAVRNMENVGSLVKNGNMALRFDSVGTCLVVREYLERAQNKLQKELEMQIRSLFDEKTRSSFVADADEAKE